MSTATSNSTVTQETYFVLREKGTGHYLCEGDFGDNDFLIAEIEDLLDPEYKLYRVWDGARNAKLVHMDRSPAKFDTAAHELIDQLNRSVTLIDAEKKPLVYSDFEMVEIHAIIAFVGDPQPIN